MRRLPRAHARLVFRVFDVEAHVAGDSSSTLARLSALLSHFVPDDTVPDAATKVDIVALLGSDNPSHHPVLLVDDAVFPLSSLPEEPESALCGRLYAAILAAATARVRSHILIHAAAVARDGKGVVLAGPPGYGKTTMAVELVNRGFSLLSDDVAAFGRKDHLLHPFVRALHVFPECLPAGVEGESAGCLLPWSGKRTLDVDAVRRDAVSGPVPMSHVILLQAPCRDDLDGSAWIRLTLSQPSHGVAPLLATAAGVSAARPTRGDGRSFAVLIDRKVDAAEVLEPVCERKGLQVLGIEPWYQPLEDFGRQPQLRAIASDRAVMQMLRHLQPGSAYGVLGQEMAGNAMRAYIELAGITGKARCYELSVGCLSDMADLVEGLVSDA